MLSLTPIASEITLKSMAAFFGGTNLASDPSVKPTRKQSRIKINQPKSTLIIVRVGKIQEKKPSSIMIPQHGVGPQSQTDSHIQC